ncbi:MAG: alcohol dehydrogenase catalytic domain-containing protein [Actinomycetales bacterium]
MRALVLNDERSLIISERDQPSADPGTTLVRVTGCGICGTDRHISKGEYPAQPPVILGHEFGGIVQQVSPGSPARVGDLVSVDPNITCGVCRDCLAGRTAFCPTLTALGVDIDGGLTEFIAAPNSQVHVLAPRVPALHAAFAEPLACCIRGLDLAGLVGGESVAVLGGGVIGQLTAQLARLAGADVTMVTRHPARRALSLELGARKAITLADAAQGEFDVVFECAGGTETFLAAQGLARRGGTVIVLGLTAQEASVPIRPFDLVVAELRIIGSFLNPGTQARACALISDGSVVVEPLVSRVVGLDEAALLLHGEPAPGEVKIIVDPSK